MTPWRLSFTHNPIHHSLTKNNNTEKIKGKFTYQQLAFFIFIPLRKTLRYDKQAEELSCFLCFSERKPHYIPVL